MKKIELHLHTQNCKQGDVSKRNINNDELINTMQKNNIGICSMTNHNKFDLLEYNFINLNKNNLLIFPLIELDVRFDCDLYICK